MVRIANKQIDLLQIANDLEQASSYDEEVGCSSSTTRNYKTKASSPQHSYSSEPPSDHNNNTKTQPNMTYNNKQTATTSLTDPPEQAVSSHFATSRSRLQQRTRAQILASSSIHAIHRNAKGHVYLDGEEEDGYSDDDNNNNKLREQEQGKPKMSNDSVLIASRMYKHEPYGNSPPPPQQLNTSNNIRTKSSSNNKNNSNIERPIKVTSSSAEQRVRTSLELAKEFNYRHNNDQQNLPQQPQHSQPQLAQHQAMEPSGMGGQYRVKFADKFAEKLKVGEAVLPAPPLATPLIL